jgi:MFS family permease
LSDVSAAKAGASTPDRVVKPTEQGFQFRTFDSFNDRDFRWFYIALLGQMGAMNMQMLVRGYLAFELTDSFTSLGLIALGSAAPMLTLSVFGGVIADRAPKKLVLQIGQSANVAIALAVGLLLFADGLEFYHLMISTFVHGIVIALMMPSRQAILPEVIGMNRLMNAISLSAAGMNLMRLGAPALGGFMIAFIGAEWVYFFMAGLYAFAVMALSRVVIRHAVPVKRQGSSGFSDLIQGLHYIRRDRTLFVLLLVSTATSLLALPYQLMLPGFVEQVLGGGPVELGLLIAVSAIGSLLGALALASLPFKRRGLALLGSGLIIGLALVGFSATTSIWLGAVFMLFIGVGSAGRQALGNILLQTYSLDEYRGRVMSIYMTQFGLMSFGAVLVGIFAEEVGGQWALGSMATALIIVTIAIVAFVPRMRELE